MAPISSTTIAQIWRYYKVGVINTLFGYALFTSFALIWNIYVAQIAAHFIGVLFNYFTISRHVFKNKPPSSLRFIASYILNYFMGLLILCISAQIFHSPYVLGLVTIISVSIINFFVLQRFVFLSESATKVVQVACV